MKKWFIHINGDTLGPLASETILSMLQQNRLQFVDYIWTSSLTKWLRVNEIDEFARAMPKYPNIPIPQEVAPIATPVAAPSVTVTATPVATTPAPTPQAAPPPTPAKLKKAWPKERLFERVPIGEASVDIVGHGNYQVLNLSEGGVLLSTDKPLAIGTEVQFKLSIKSENKILEMTGIVLRHGHDLDGKPGFAIQYKRLNPAHKRLIKDYVRQKTA